MNTRLKELRKHLGLNQEEFGSKLGLTRSAICNYENGTRTLTEHIILSVCREYNVNRTCLVDGIGDMFTNITDMILNELASQFDLSAEDIKLVSDFCRLSKDQRVAVIYFLRGK